MKNNLKSLFNYGEYYFKCTLFNINLCCYLAQKLAQIFTQKYFPKRPKLEEIHLTFEKTQVKMIQKLNDIYLINDKLLYISDDFIGFDPQISKGLNFERMVGPNNTVPKSMNGKVEDFKIEGQEYLAFLLSVLIRGPLSGYKRIEILQNGNSIINFQYGSHGFGTNYKKGKKFVIKNDAAWLLLEGNQFKEEQSGISLLAPDITASDFHLLKFNNFIIPIEIEPILIPHELDAQTMYYPKDIEFLRQKDWIAEGKIDNEAIQIIQTSIHNMTLTQNGKFELGGSRNYLHQLEFNFKQEQYFFSI